MDRTRASLQGCLRHPQKKILKIKGLQLKCTVKSDLMLFSEETIRENTVQVERLSHSLFEKTLSGIHKGRLKSLLACASGLVRRSQSIHNGNRSMYIGPSKSKTQNKASGQVGE